MKQPLLRLLFVVVVLAAGAAAVLSLLDSDEPRPVAEQAERISEPEPQAISTPEVAPESEAERVTAEPAAARAERELQQTDETGYALGSGQLAGRVVTQNHQPVAEAEVALFVADAAVVFSLPGTRKPTGRTTRTDRDGVYLFDRLPAGENYVIVAAHPEMATGEYAGQRVEENDSVVVPDIVLSAGPRVHGTVSRAGGSGPVPGATVELWDSVQSSFQKEEEKRPWRTTLTDTAGHYEFFNVHFNACEVQVSASGLATASKSNAALFSQNEDREINFELAEAVQIGGKVVDARDRPVPGTTLHAYQFGQRAEAGYSKGQAVSAANGTFRFDGLAAGTYKVVARAQGYSDKMLPNVEGGTLNVVLELERRGGVSGRVVAEDTGRPVAAFQVVAREIGADGAPGGRRSRPIDVRDEGGAFFLSDLDPGEYVAEATTAGYAPSLSAPFVVARDEVTQGVEIRLGKGGSIRGRVTDQGGAPVAGVKIRLNDNDYVYNPVVALFESFGGADATPKLATTTKADGSFQIDLVVPGIYQVEAEVAGLTPAAVNDVQVVEDQVSDVGRIALIRGGSLVGQCRDHLGQAFSDGLVNVSEESPGRAGWFKAVRPDYDGRYELNNLKPGRYKVSLSPDRVDGAALNPLIKITYSKDTEKTVEVRDGRTEEVNLVLPPPKR